MNRPSEVFYPYGSRERELLATGMHASQVEEALREMRAGREPILSPLLSGRLALWSSYLQLLGTDRTAPMIVLVGGGSGTGKSTLASEIAYRLGLRNVIGTDMLREVLRRNYPVEVEPTLHENTYNAWKPLTAVYDPEALRRGYYRQSQLVCSAAQAILERALDDGEGIALEGIHLLPSLLSPQLLRRPNVAFILLSIADPQLHRARLYDRGASTHLRKPGKRYEPVFDRIRLVHDMILRDAGTAAVPIVEQSAPDVSLQEALDAVYRVLERAMTESKRTM